MTAWLLPGLLIGLLTSAVGPAVAAEPKPKAAPTAGKKPDAGTLANNAATTARIKTALLADKVAPGMRIDVDTSDGVVTLSGQVNNRAQKSRAEQVAKKTKGVHQVINHLTIKPMVPGKRGAGDVVGDVATTTRIKSALLADKVAPGMKINVDTKLGVVTLSGEVGAMHRSNAPERSRRRLRA